MHVAADALTAHAMVVLQDRPVIAFSPWLAGALRECTESGISLQIVSPSECRLSLALRSALTGQQARWVVHSATGYHDGLTGAPLHWDGTAFSPVPDAQDYAPHYLTRPTAAIGLQLTLTWRVLYGMNEPLGGAVERVYQAVHGRPPVGWGTAEPVANPWRREELTALCHSRPEATTWLTVVGERAAVPEMVAGTVQYSPVPGGVEESLTLVAGYPAAVQPDLAMLPGLIAGLAPEYRLLSLSAQLSPGRSDLTTEPRWAGSPAPIGLAVSVELGGGSPVPPQLPVRQLGAVWWYELGDGHSAEGWQRYQLLMRHLRPSG
ncbi:MAG: hypothetical protein JWN00_2492 [Actinomycetia bacterium]|nr:hypothetical protein [Actinomycetes bacterium]